MGFKSWKFAVAFLSALAWTLVIFVEAEPQQLFIYDRSNSDDSKFYLSTLNPEPELGGYTSLELSPTSNHLTCRIGGWIFYSGTNFTGVSTPLQYAQGLTCGALISGQNAGSTRFAGLAADARASTLTLYANARFLGNGHVLEASSGNITHLGPVGSVYKTGSGAWTLFTGLEYTGFSFCMRESMIEDLGTIVPIVQSVRSGCE